MHLQARLQRVQRAPSIELETLWRLGTGIVAPQFTPWLYLDKGKGTMPSDNYRLQQTAGLINAPWTPPEVQQIHSWSPPLRATQYL